MTKVTCLYCKIRTHQGKSGKSLILKNGLKVRELSGEYGPYEKKVDFRQIISMPVLNFMAGQYISCILKYIVPGHSGLNANVP